MATLTITPASGEITAKKTVAKVAVSETDSNDSSAYDATKYPTWPEIRYKLEFVPPSGDNKYSPVFTPSADGDWQFDNFIFDIDGSWDINLLDTADDSEVTSISVTVV